MNCPSCQQDNRATAHFCANCRAPLLLQGKYRITRLLGRGGYGAVYQAEHTGLGGAPYAVKELLPDPSANAEQQQAASEQFRLEASLLAKLRHTALPQVMDFFTEGNRDYLVMEFVEGDTLEERLARNRAPFAESQVLTWAAELCDVLTYLHTRQPNPVIHRDVKPSNIKITADGKLKLIDFGIAKLLVAGVGTKGAARAVSAPYSPMEQYGKGTDARSDIYSLGVTLYELLTGRLPPEAPDRASEGVAPLRRINPGLGASTEAIVLKAMAERPPERFQSAAEMKQVLAVAPPIIVRPESVPMPQPSAVAPTVAVPVLTQPSVLVPTIPVPAEKGRSRGAVWVIATIGVIVFFCLAAAVLGIGVISNQQAQTAATSTALARAATSTAQAQATATALAGMMTATAQAQQQTATAQAQARMTADAQTATASARASMIFSDPFDDNVNRWTVTDSVSDYGTIKRTIANGKYRWEVKALKSVNARAVPVMNSISDFQLTADCQRISGASTAAYGVIFRFLDADNYYMFIITDKSFHFSMQYKGEWKTLIDWTPSSAIQPGKVNRLTVKAQGPHFVLFINDKQVGETDDNRLSSGKAGLVFELYNAGDEAVFEFDNLGVRAP